MNKYNYKCPIRRVNPYKQKLMEAIAKSGVVAENEVSRKFLQGPRKVLLTDITYLRRDGKAFSYMCAIIDAFTKQLLAWAVHPTIESDVVLEAVNKLLADHGSSLTSATIIHSDQGSQYKSARVIDLLNDSGLRRSMSRVATPWDNAPQESFFGHMKDEIGARIEQCDSNEGVCIVLEDWTDYYNNDRYQWGLAKLSPNEYYQYIISGKYPLPITPPEADDSDDTD